MATPDPLDQIKELNGNTDDALARQEAQKYRSNKDKREDKEQQTIHWVFIIGTWAAGIAGVIILLIYMLHFVLPERINWPTAVQIQQIERIFFSGTVGAILTAFVKKKVEK